MRRLKIEHLTTYRFGTPVQFGPHKLLIRPREGHDLRIESWELKVTPVHQVRWHRDIHGNSVAMVHFTESSDTLHVASAVVIQHFDEYPLDFLLAESAVSYPFRYDPAERNELVPYQTSCYPNDASHLGNWIAQFWKPGWKVQTFSLLDQINRFIARNFGYARRDEPGVQSPRETLTKRGGSCRDFATLFMEGCRSLGFASRFASGYLHSPGRANAQPGATHAWAEVYLPGAGWKGFDSTLGEMTGANHIAAAVSCHPADVPPVSGTYAGSAPTWSNLFVGVRVAQV